MANENEERTEHVLTRRPGESFWLDTASGLIKVTQLTRWRIAIEAPPSVTVRRTDDESQPDT